ncbi:Fe2OG dioxygenase domain-containing protein [Citrus sinensis]|nr:Fe2OG dioxygenase domain-containing protein [Citrus sinensis]
MALEASIDRRNHAQSATTNGAVVLPPASYRLRLNPSSEHKPDSYDDLHQLEFTPLLFSSLERYLPPTMLSMSRDVKFQYMRDILMKYSRDGERTREKDVLLWQVICATIQSAVSVVGSEAQRVQTEDNIKLSVLSSLQPLHRELFTMHAPSVLVPAFVKAVRDNTEASFRSIMAEPIPGIYTFEMLQPRFCEMLLSEVENFERWVHDTRFRIMRPNTMNKFGAVLDDFGLETMLDKLMNDFIRPISKVFFPEVGGSTLDSHHGFVVEYGMDRDVELGFHVDDSEVTLNVCLGREFSGGELFFRGVRCDKHVNTETQSEEILDYSHVPGYAVLHRGRHRHGARATTSGSRVNLLVWCRSSVFRELKKYQKECSSWCAECQREKKERQCISIAATKQELLKRIGNTSS